MKKILLVFLMLLLTAGTSLAITNTEKNEQYAYMKIYGVSKKQMRKISRVEKRTNKSLEAAWAKINRMKWDMNIPHDVLKAYAQKRLGKIKIAYNKRLDKILTMEQKQKYMEYISQAY